MRLLARRRGIGRYSLAGPHPASYYTGPLGTNNILPATTGGALFGLWSGETPWTAQQRIDRMTAMQTAAGRQLDVVGVHYGGGGTFGGQDCAWMDMDPILDWAVTNGSAVYLSFTPGRLTTNDDSVVKQTINGQRDACYDAVAAHLRDKGVRIMYRPLHEWDWDAWFKRADGTLDYTTDETKGAAMVSAWQHIVGRFQGVGASNVGFFWCPDELGSSPNMVGLSYPGDAYVDWVGSDRYNFDMADGWSSCIGPGWSSFAQIFNHTPEQCATPRENYHSRFGVGKGKPFFVGETSCRYDSATPTRKSNWYADIAKAKDPADSVRYMSNLIGVCVFDHYITAENNSDWRIDSNQTSAMADAGTLGTQDPAYGRDGWVSWAGDARWNVGVAP